MVCAFLPCDDLCNARVACQAIRGASTPRHPKGHACMRCRKEVISEAFEAILLGKRFKRLFG
jgi:hypothetical protein